MVNMAVPFSRLNYALQTLVAEIRARYSGAPIRVDTVTGYKSTSNFTGHNADSNGVVHAVDIFVGTPGNLNETQAQELVKWLAVEGRKGVIDGHPDRLYYMIYRDNIMGDWSGWTTWDGSGYGHYDHIHISTCDLYWGDPAPISALDYDSKAPWGFNGSTIKPAGDTITPTTQEYIMAWTDLIQEYKEDGRTKAGPATKTAGFIMGNLNQWVTRILKGQAAIIANQKTLLARQQANDSATHLKLNAIAKALPGVVDYDRIQGGTEEALRSVSTATVEPEEVA